MTKYDFKKIRELIENYGDSFNESHEDDSTIESIEYYHRIKDKFLEDAPSYLDDLLSIVEIVATLDDPKVDRGEFGYECFYCHNNLKEDGHSDNCRWVKLQEKLDYLQHWIEL